MTTTTSYLNKENIDRSANGVEYHPLHPFLPENAKILFLGSFPPQRKRWCMDFYYPNFINDHWRIEGQLFFGDRNHFVDVEQKRFRIDEIIAFCQEKGLAFYDTSTAIRRLQDNASDKFLEVVEPTNIPALISKLPHLRAIVTTGEKATETICTSLGIQEIPKVNTFVLVSAAPPLTSHFSPLSSQFAPKAHSPLTSHLSSCGSAAPPLTLRLRRTTSALSLWRLPSSSRAYPLAFDKKVEAYRLMFKEVFDEI